MPEKEVLEVANKAKMIVNGYAFSELEDASPVSKSGQGDC